MVLQIRKEQGGSLLEKVKGDVVWFYKLGNDGHVMFYKLENNGDVNELQSGIDKAIRS